MIARPSLPNGPGLAAILAAALGSFTLAVLTVAADTLPRLRTALIFSKPTGPLSGVSTVAIVLWLLAWGVLDRLWNRRTLPAARVNAVAFTLLAVSLLLTFPPIGDLF
jgi:hypothetical protein